MICGHRFKDRSGSYPHRAEKRLKRKAAHAFAVVFGEPDTERKMYVRFGEGLREIDG